MTHLRVCTDELPHTREILSLFAMTEQLNTEVKELEAAVSAAGTFRGVQAEAGADAVDQGARTKIEDID